jgi:site-specific DNA-methyltransferase (adenine-specific)
VKHQCPTLAENIPALNQSELFDAEIVRQEATKIRTDKAQSDPDPASLESDSAPPPKPPRLAHHDADHDVRLYHGDCLDLLDKIAAKHPDGVFDMVFADPPYFLSNGGSTCKGGERVSVDKGHWDQSGGLRADFKFTVAWLRRVKRVLNPALS